MLIVKSHQKEIETVLEKSYPYLRENKAELKRNSSDETVYIVFLNGCYTYLHSGEPAKEGRYK